MKKIILLAVLTSIICLISGCGPGQPFEIEEHFMSQSANQIPVVSVK